MENNEIRWIQRLNTYKRALARLTEVVEQYRQRGLSALEKDGMIQRFEYTRELAWKVLKNFIEYQGGTERMMGSRDVIRQAVALGLIDNAEPWFDMLESRNTTANVYDEETETNVIEQILTMYYPILAELASKMEKRV
jgi:nucleotidyltransferase substrate binding protein (TIGR01987 family)